MPFWPTKLEKHLGREPKLRRLVRVGAPFAERDVMEYRQRIGLTPA
jgi:hypothetical protein